MTRLSSIRSGRPIAGSPLRSRVAHTLAMFAVVCLLLILTGCLTTEQSKSPAAPDTANNAPQLLSQTGLYGRSGQIDSHNQYFSPQYPLWTDGAAKSRWIYLPEGSQIDISNVDAWKFPVGTKLWKEFSFNGYKVETRMIWRTSANDWVFASYVWNEEQTDASLAPEAGIANTYEFTAGKRHSIPAESDCRSCHLSSPGVALGFSALQLSDDRDPLAPHQDSFRVDMLTLRKLLEQDRLNPPRQDLVTHPPRIRAENPAARAAMGYLSANCGGCHNSTGPLARLGLNMLHNVDANDSDPEPAVLTLLNSRGRFTIANLPPDSTRFIQPGKPEHSSVLHRMKSRRPASQMPPLGTVIVDSVAVELVQAWIENMK